MSSQRKPRTERYSAQIRASQYDPDVDANHYNYQFNTHHNQQPQLHHPQPQRAISPRVSMDMSAATVNFLDHYPVSSSSSNSTASTFINLTNPSSSNSSNHALADPVVGNNAPDGSVGLVGAVSPGQTPPASQSTVSNSIAVTSSGDETPAAATPAGLTSTPSSSSSSRTPPTSTPTTAPLVSSATSSSTSKSPFSIFPTILGRKKSNSTSAASPSSRRHTKTSQQRPSPPPHPLPRSFADGRQFHHAKTASVASVRSRLVARTSRSSLQLNLRTNQNNPNPTLIPTPSQSPGGTWDDPDLAPSPFYANMDPAFLKEQQLAGSGANMMGDGGGGFSMNRQDDGRLQLEQARAYYNSRKCITWTRSKFLLLLANIILLGYAVTCTVIMTMSWRGDQWTKPYLDSGIMMIANHNVLLLMMVTAPFGVFVALLGFIGIFTQSRKILSWYTVLLWPLFAMVTSIGYICFRRSHVSLYMKLKFSWINEYTRDDRLVIQNALNCCGYRSSGDYPSYDLHCFPRAPLPSCETKFLQYQQDLLSNTSSAAFTLVPIQLLVMLVALLCSNHIDSLYRTANPIIPKSYTQ
ncbi:hypothetical protein KI688_004637 [Linnemannia hyalina]|uniref:Tetraspanin Tsp2 n=1 Tax=Linnemannia hyalina TaxID=64524 RepID=A0A9P7XM02_9FUNG|nr:hypothetical protein KI688_004637 [Linnemannia hyalina]